MKFRIHRDEIKREFPELKIRKEYFVFKGEKIDEKRTPSQNNSLHLFFKQFSDECLDKGIDMRTLVRDDFLLEVTPENAKWLWKKLQKGLVRTESTTELKNNGQIDMIYNNFVKNVVDKTKGEIIVPEFPSLKVQNKNVKKVDYPENKDNEVTAF